MEANDNLSEENNQFINKNGDNVLKYLKVVNFKTSDYDLNFNEREAKYKDFDHILCEKCNQEISKCYFYCKCCHGKEPDSCEQYRMKYGRPNVAIFNTSDYDLDLVGRRMKYKESYCILCEKCSQEISMQYYYCEDCYNEETDVKERNRMKCGIVFKISDYDLGFDEREAKYKDYDYIICEKCNEQVNRQYLYCNDCYDKETDVHVRICMKYGISKKVGIFKTSDYDWGVNHRIEKYRDYDYIICEKCNEQIDRQYFYCNDCCNKKTDNYERICMKYGRSKVGIFVTSDYDLELIQRKVKYQSYDHILCESCYQKIDKFSLYCNYCCNEKTDNYERICMKYGRSKIGIFMTSDYDLDHIQRSVKYQSYDHILCESCHQEIDKFGFYCNDCYNKETDNYERICMKYGNLNGKIFKSSYYDLNIDERKHKLENGDILCEECYQIINELHLYCEGCYHNKIDENEKNHMKYGRCGECFNVCTDVNWCPVCDFNNFEQFLQDFNQWVSENKIIYNSILEPNVGISDYDLDEDDRQVKYKDYDCILCERCNQKIYYYCYDCFNEETKEFIKSHYILLQIYENIYSKLYHKEKELKELKEFKEFQSIFQYHLNTYLRFYYENTSLEFDYNSKEVEKIEQFSYIERLNEIINQIKDQKTKLENIRYERYYCSCSKEKVKNLQYYCCNCYDKETDIDRKNHIKFGKCKKCFQIFENLGGCLLCKPKRFQENFDKWTSGNVTIDKLIQDNQLQANKEYGVLEWIPYSKFTNIKYLDKGGFAKVYSAIWKDGRIKKWSQLFNDWRKSESLTVALKELNESESISKDFLNEINFFNKVNSYLCVIKCFGITQNPITRNYAFVLQYMENGNLRSYLRRTVNSLTWKQRIDKIYDICLALKDIHSHGLIHKDLHPGNIFIDYTFAFIGDFGFSMPANEISTNSNVYGVMPYMAPEILRGNPHTLSSDVYSLGVIINEIISVIPPFNDRPHNHILTVGICEGLRPTIRTEIPNELKELIERCWDANPEKRPTSEEVFYILSDNLNAINNIPLKRLSYDFNELTNCQAIYISQKFNYKNLPEPTNWSTQQIIVSTRNTTNVLSEDHSECFECAIGDIQ